MILSIDHDDFAPCREQGIITMGWSTLQTGYEVGRPNPSHHVVILTGRGGGRVRTRRGCRQVDCDSLLLLPIGCAHHYETADEPWEILWFHLTRKNPWVHGGSRESIREFHGFLRIRELLRGIAADHTSLDLNGGYMVEIGQFMLFDLLDRILGPGTHGGAHSPLGRIEAVWIEVRNRLHYPWSVEEMAAMAGYSRSQFARKCSQYYGMPPGTRLTTLRMETAMMLLRSSDWPVYEIAERVGYGDPFAFSTAFRRRVGISPREYRVENRIADGIGTPNRITGSCSSTIGTLTSHTVLPRSSGIPSTASLSSTG
jgi:AraC-like DNA-binding protein